jgi:hypothetical protein
MNTVAGGFEPLDQVSLFGGQSRAQARRQLRPLIADGDDDGCSVIGASPGG